MKKNIILIGIFFQIILILSQGANAGQMKLPIPPWGVYIASDNGPYITVNFSNRFADLPCDGAPGTTKTVHTSYLKVSHSDLIHGTTVLAAAFGAIPVGAAVEALDTSRTIWAIGGPTFGNPLVPMDLVPYKMVFYKR